MSDYDYEPAQGKGMFLRLKSKGESVTFRVASSPYREPVVWKEGLQKPLSEDETSRLTEDQWAALMRNPDYTISEQFHWIVIDRSDGQARIFTGAPSVYKAIKAYAQEPQWGDPREYDIKVTRSEKPGSYYEITAMPNKHPITTRELEIAGEINMAEKKPNAAPLNEKQIDDLSDWMEKHQNNNQTSIEGVGSRGGGVGSSGSDVGPGRQKAREIAQGLKPSPAATDDVNIQDLGDEPINLDDIPF